MSTTPVSRPAGSRRFWVTVLCFALANAAAWLAYDHYVRHRVHPLLEVLQSAPGDKSQVTGRPTFWWTFNLDVAQPAPNAPPPGVITPAVAGKWEWSNPRTLNFVPDAPLSRATAYTVSLLPDRLQTPDGFRLAKPQVTAVHTVPLEVLSVRQLAFDQQDQLVLEINFNDDVIASEAMQHISLKTSDGKPLKFLSHGEATSHAVRVITDPIPAPARPTDGAYLTVEISPGLAGRGGPLGLTSAYNDRVTFVSELAATAAHSYFAERGGTVISLEFNNPADPAVLKPLLSVEPSIPFTVTRGYGGLELHGAFQPSTRYAIRIAQAPAGTPHAARPRPDTLSVFVPDRPASVWFEHEEGYLGSAGNRTLLAHAVNLSQIHATVTRIYDNNLVTWRNTRVGIDAVDRPIASRDIKLPPLKNKTQDVRLSLDDLLSADQSHDGVYLVRLSTTSSIETDEDDVRGFYGRWQSSATVTLSDIALTAKKGRTGVTVWATSLRTAEPLAGVRMRLYSSKNQYLGDAVTGDNGIATIVPAPMAEGEEPSVVLADRPDAQSAEFAKNGSASAARDLTWLDLRSSRVNFGEADTTGAAYLRTGHEAFIYTDRGVYRPGETVHLRAIVRGPDGATPPSFPVRWQFRRPDLHNWKSFMGQIDADGAVSLDLPLPNDLPTGQWSVVLGLPGHEKEEESFGSGAFQVEDFMPNRMQVGLKLDGAQAKLPDGQEPRFAVSDKPLSAQVQADYLFGKPVTERPARLVARLDPIPFSSPKWSGWTFGDSATTAATLEGLKLTGHRAELPEQTLDAKGHAAFDLDWQSLLSGDETAAPHSHAAKRSRHKQVSDAKPVAKSAEPYVGPWRLTVTASVIETGGRAVSASRQAQLDPVPWYIGIKQKTSAASADLSSTFEVALVSPDGSVAPEKTALDAILYRETWNNSLSFEGSHYVYHATRLLDPVGAKLRIEVSNGKGTCEVTPPDYGSYVLRVRDPQSGVMSSVAFYAGQGAWEDNISRENPEKLELIVRAMPQASALMRSIRGLDPAGAMNAARAMLGHPLEGGKIHAGDMAQVIVRSPFAGHLLLSVETDDVVSTRVIDMPASHVSIPIQIPEACRPNAYITATVVRSVDPDAAWQTHRAIGTVRVPVDNSDWKLNIELSAPAEIRPATSLDVAMRITDSGGRPVENAAVTLAAVDEGICQLTGFTTPDPFGFFTRTRGLGVGTSDLFSDLMPEVPKAGKISAVGGDKDAYDPRHQSPVSARRVKPVSLVSGVLHTDSDGIAHAGISVPQFIGKLRLMAVASASASFASQEGAVLVRSPLLVQSSWPRFAAPGDKFLVPLLVFNNMPADADASVTLHVVDGPLRFGNATEFSLPVKLAANGQATQTVEVNASNAIGVSHVTLTASANGESYIEDVEIPVRPASPEISLGGYAVATPDKPAEISMPGGMLKGTGYFEVKVTPWPSLQLPQGLDYLDRYPYGCLEQTTSTLFPLVYLSDIGQQLGPGMFEKQRVADKVQAGITRLIGMQTAGGGLAMWPAYRDPWPWGSVYAAHFLIEANNAGHSVPEEFQKQLLSYVRGLLNQSTDDPDVLETQAYACYVLALAGRPERAVMSRLAEVVNTPRPDGVVLPGQARLHLAAAWLASGRRDLAESLIPQQLPAPRTTRSLAGALGSPVRDRAILVNTLLSVEPDHPALPELVQQLADSGRKGQWCSTQDTAFAVMALGRYLRQSKPVAPYEGAALWVGESRVGEAAKGNSITWEAGPKNESLLNEGSKLRVQVSGAAGAKAHVSWLQVGVPLKAPAAADHGLSVRRRLLDERGKPLNGNRVHSGDLVQVELTISSDTPLEYVAIDDLLPAGLEIENPRLLTTAADAAEHSKDAQEANPFVDSRLDMRDDRLILIGNLTAAGKGTYVYTARAVTPGSFVLPPVHAECMYDTATNSLSSGGTIEVLPAGSSRIANVQD